MLSLMLSKETAWIKISVWNQTDRELCLIIADEWDY